MTKRKDTIKHVPPKGVLSAFDDKGNYIFPRKRTAPRIGTCYQDPKTGKMILAGDFPGEPDLMMDLTDLKREVDTMGLGPNFKERFEAAAQRLPDSGQRRSFATGSVRDVAAGKGRFDLIPEEFLIALANHYEAGAVKYGDNNWLKGQPFSVFFDSAMRHLVKAKMERRKGDERAPDHHLIAAIWNLVAVLTFEERGRAAELNDLSEKATAVSDTKEGGE